MFSGKRILIVETEFLIALDTQRILEGAEANGIVFARTPSEAARLESRWTGFDLAVCEVPLGKADEQALFHTIRSHGVGLVLTTVDVGLRHGLPGLDGVPVLVKPFSEQDLLAACRAALRPAEQPPQVKCG